MIALVLVRFGRCVTLLVYPWTWIEPCRRLLVGCASDTFSGTVVCPSGCSCWLTADVSTEYIRLSVLLLMLLSLLLVSSVGTYRLSTVPTHGLYGTFTNSYNCLNSCRVLLLHPGSWLWFGFGSLLDLIVRESRCCVADWFTFMVMSWLRILFPRPPAFSVHLVSNSPVSCPSAVTLSLFLTR